METTIIRLDDVAPQPWRNGGGRTRELLVWPDAGDWRLRISLADIEKDGPFSAFPGVTRWFTVVQGQGVVLSFGPRTETLGPGSAPLRFDGAAAPGCELIGGSTRDLNLMLRGGEGVMEPAAAGRPRDGGGFAQRGLFTAVPGTLRCQGASTPLPAWTLAWQRDAIGALVFEPDEPASGPVGWWLGFSPAGTL
ncbi:MAG: HutD family protein [Acidobacteriota bacterium]